MLAHWYNCSIVMGRLRRVWADTACISATLAAARRQVLVRREHISYEAASLRACYALQRYTWYDFSMTRQPYPSDVSDAERDFVASTGSARRAPSLTFMTEDAPQRAPAMTGINVPPLPPPHARGERGGGKVHVAEAVHYLYARKYITGSRRSVHQ